MARYRIDRLDFTAKSLSRTCIEKPSAIFVQALAHVVELAKVYPTDAGVVDNLTVLEDSGTSSLDLEAIAYELNVEGARLARRVTDPGRATPDAPLRGQVIRIEPSPG